MADHLEKQQESKGCGMFDFLKKKPEDVTSPDNDDEKKPSLAQSLHLSDNSSSSSDEEDGEKGEKKKKKKVCEHNKEDVEAQCETEEKKGIMEKIKEKLPAPKGRDHDQVDKPEQEDGKEKGFMEKMKEKLPHEKPAGPELTHDNGKEKGFMEKIMEKLPGHAKHDDNDEKKKET